MPDEEELKKGRHLALRYLTYRDRTAFELEDYLTRKHLKPAVVKEVMAKMRRYLYIDDRKFTQNYINYRKSSGFGPLKIRFELLSKKVPDCLIDELLEASFSEEEALQIMRTLLQKRTSQTECFDQKWFRRQLSYLARRGFREGLALRVLQEIVSFDDLSHS